MRRLWNFPLIISIKHMYAFSSYIYAIHRIYGGISRFFDLFLDKTGERDKFQFFSVFLSIHIRSTDSNGLITSIYIFFALQTHTICLLRSAFSMFMCVCVFGFVLAIRFYSWNRKWNEKCTIAQCTSIAVEYNSNNNSNNVSTDIFRKLKTKVFRYSLEELVCEWRRN